jgi:lysozyme
VGYGHRLTEGAPSTEIGQEFADWLFENDFENALLNAQMWIGKTTWDKLTDARKHVLVDMMFNLGFVGMSKFRRLRNAIIAGNWQWAADEIMDSLYAKQVPNRAERNRHRMAMGAEVE